MKQKKNVKITFAKDDVKTQVKRGKKNITKNISINDFIDAFKGNIVLRTGIMSPGVKYYSKSGNKEIIVVESPPKMRKLKNVRFKSSRVDVPTPPTLFFFILVNGKLSSSRCYCIKTPMISEDQPLYYFPLGNMSSTICWGGANRQMSQYKITLSNVNGLVEAFYSSSFNTDLDSGRRLTKNGRIAVGGGANSASLLRYLRGKKKFPMDFLLKAGESPKSIIKIYER